MDKKPIFQYQKLNYTYIYRSTSFFRILKTTVRFGFRHILKEISLKILQKIKKYFCS